MVLRTMTVVALVLAVPGVLPARADREAAARNDEPKLARDRTIGTLEPVATFDGPMPTGVAVSNDGRIFVNFPRWGDDVQYTVAEVKNGKTVPYPSPEINRADPERAADTLLAVQSVVVDPTGKRLWLVDTGNGFGPLRAGGPKLVGVDLATNTVVKKVLLPLDVAIPGTYLNDVRFDLRRGPEGMAFITDSGATGIIAIDLASGRSWRRLQNHQSTKPEPQYMAVAEGAILLRRGERFQVGSDGIAMSPDGKWLYYSVLTGRRLFRVSVDALADPQKSEADVAATVEDFGEKGGSADGLESDAEGRVYLTDFEHNSIHRRNADGRLETLVHDPRLLWPDSLSLAADGYLYVTANQIHRQANFQGTDKREKPYVVFRLKVDGTRQSQSSSPSAAAQPVQHYDEALLSKPGHTIAIEKNVHVPMRDGVTVSVDIYRPNAEGRFPAILYRTPYSNNTEANIAFSKYFAERGYVYLHQDVRGKFDSKGDFYPFRHEPNDGYDMDEWIGKQPWFNGKLGTMGGSYSGFTQWGQAIRGSKYLTAMAPQFTTPDIYGNWLYVDGALNYAFALSWGAISIDGHVGQATGSAVDMTRTYRHLPIIDAPKTAGHRAPHYRDWVTHPTRDAYWNDVSYEHEYATIAVPMISVGGWYDIFVRGTLQDDVEVRAKGKTEVARRGKRLMIGPWIHGASTRDNAGPGQAARPDAFDFGAAAAVDLNKVYLRWFDYWLKGIENGVKDEPPVKIFVMGENVWRYEQEWPLKRAQPTKYYLSSGGRANTLNGDGTLSAAAPAAGGQGAAADSYTYDPDNPVPTTGGTSCCAALTSVGPLDQRAVEAREDVLVYTSEALTEPVEVTGPVVLKLYAATSAKDTDWTAKLVDVSPDGTARNVQEGILRARYRETRGKSPGSLLEPGKVYEYTIDLWSASNTFLPGHRIRLEVSSSNFPHFDRNLNTGEDTATSARVVTARQTIHHTAQYPSHLVLPIIPRAAKTPPSAAAR